MSVRVLCLFLACSSGLNDTKEMKLIREIFETNNFQLRIVGGTVRDLLMDVMPTDIDLSIDAKPHETEKLLSDANIKVHDGRHGRSSNQEYTNDWRIGASRRDFTIISLYLDDFIVADQR
ncbi:unnamed protein product [Dracunculus medinensis]|uniref:PolyA_pol domain-containing protein n=1 Tax=Dracunculus medinensis TaxID=318479 RepID=A0A0N4UGK4_DRAME|nr:unnamed protein product [Dracunculus medinensis]